MGNKLCNFLLVWVAFVARGVLGMKKGLRDSESLCIHDGGDEGDRTPDLLTASQALSQLSYAPNRCGNNYTRTETMMQEKLLTIFELSSI